MGTIFKQTFASFLANIIFFLVVLSVLSFGGWWILTSVLKAIPASREIYKNYTEEPFNYEAVIDARDEATRLQSLINKKDRGEQLSQYGTFVVIPITGEISRSPGSFNEIFDQLFIAANITQDVRAIIFLVDSPGGEVTACDNLFFEIQKLKTQDIRIVTYVRGISASGAYYITANSDYIIASPTAMVGSIGVIMKWLNFEGLASNLGITEETIKSSEMKDIGSPFKKMSQRERMVLQKLINNAFVRFKTIVRLGRQMNDHQLSMIATGEVWTADDAKKLNLVDHVGYMRDAFLVTTELTGVINPNIIIYRKEIGFWDSIKSMAPINQGSSQITTYPEMIIHRTLPPPTLLYQWIP